MINQLKLIECGYTKQEAHSINVALSSKIKSELIQIEMIVKGNRDHIKSMPMRAFMAHYKKQDVIAFCEDRLKARRTSTNVERWELLLKKVKELC